MIAAIVPGCMGTVSLAIDLFGIDRINPGHWASPVFIHNLTQDEYDFCVEFFAEYGKQVYIYQMEE